MTNATSWFELQPGVLWHPYDCLQMYSLNSHSVLYKLPVFLQISSYMPLLGGHTSNSAWLASTPLIRWNLQANLNKKTLQWLTYQAYYALVYQEYKKQISPAKEDSLCHNSQCHQHREKVITVFIPSYWNPVFLKQKGNNIIEVKIYTLKIRNVIPCKASETRSFIHCFASWSYEPVESCMQ